MLGACGTEAGKHGARVHEVQVLQDQGSHGKAGNAAQHNSEEPAMAAK